ncbi:uncharacterized protein LOC133309410 [Gastrolobium bilobum]|uniref:uncharacterized protein LOC133309410 n=1 Tax=Gastrolobium bilobum TaxID=150636 RepID=UPI002AB11424|nr:uncharacterized protein LOC133309410 [Gastrolobium bilobum]
MTYERQGVEHKMFMMSSTASSSSLCCPLSSLRIPPPHSVNASLTPFAIHKLRGGARRRRSRKWRAINKSGEDHSVTVASPATTSIEDDNVVDSATDVVRNFYGRINAHDVDSVQYLIADNCVYEDLVFPRPFVGRKEILEFFKKFTNSTSTDLQFVIDDLSSEDSSSVGVIWHLEWKGKPFPFSKGCSFYRLEVINGKRQITYGRDSVEPAVKPGDAALAAIRSVTWLLQQFPQLADRL